MPNILAYAALALWPLITVLLFRRLPPSRAVIWTILAGYLLLPPLVVLKLTGLPGIDKYTAPVIAAWLYCLIARGERVHFIPEHPVGKVLAVMVLITPFATVLTNGEPVAFTSWLSVPGLGIKDALADFLRQVSLLLAWALARHYIRDATAIRDLLAALVIAMLAYSLPMLIEVRMSPQINVWVYGFFQHSFLQMMRQGGFRPIVFLEHGLWVALMTTLAVMAAVALSRGDGEALRTRWRLAAIYLFVVLVLCKTMGALIYASLLVPVLALASPRWLSRFAVLLAVFALLYPALSLLGMFPAKALVDLAAALSEERSLSLAYRFFMEQQLLDRATEKIWLGWGGWGRNMLYDEISAEPITIPDGRWIIVLGTWGLSGFIAEFGLLCLPIFALARRDNVPLLVTAAMLMLALNVVDLLPNATLTPVTWLFAGGLLGYVEALRKGTTQIQPDREKPAPLAETAPRTLI